MTSTTTAPPSGSTPRGDRRANRSPVLLEAAEPEPGIRGLSRFSAAPGPDHRSAGHRRPSRRRARGGAAVQQTIDRPTSHRRPGLPGTGGVTPPYGPFRPEAAAATAVPGAGPAPPAVPGRGPGAVVRREPGRSWSRPRSFCDDCPLRDACLAGALDRGEPWGVWGGEIFERGVVIARKRPRGRPRKVDRRVSRPQQQSGPRPHGGGVRHAVMRTRNRSCTGTSTHWPTAGCARCRRRRWPPPAPAGSTWPARAARRAERAVRRAARLSASVY